MLKEQLREKLLCCYNKEIQRETFNNDSLLYNNNAKLIYELLEIIDFIDFTNIIEVRQFEELVRLRCSDECSTTTSTTTLLTTTILQDCGLSIINGSITNGNQRLITINYTGLYLYDFINFEVIQNGNVVYKRENLTPNGTIVVAIPYSIVGVATFVIGKYNCSASINLNIPNLNTTTSTTTLGTTTTLQTTTIGTTTTLGTTTTVGITTTCDPNIDGEGGCNDTTTSTTTLQQTTTINNTWNTIATYYKC